MKKLLILIAIGMSLCTAPLAAAVQHTATVNETMNAGGYTYMNVAEGEQNFWVAVTAIPVQKGQTVTFVEEMWMPNFKSRALNRTFEKILFARMLSAPGQRAQNGGVIPGNAPKSVMKKAEGGYSVAEVFAKRATLKGKTIRVRGKVTKVSKQIMKRNWVHIEDGTGNAATNDLVFTSPDTVNIKEGDTVIATGTVETDKDFGYGYFYPVIIEKSRFSAEK